MLSAAGAVGRGISLGSGLGDAVLPDVSFILVAYAVVVLSHLVTKRHGKVTRPSPTKDGSSSSFTGQIDLITSKRAAVRDLDLEDVRLLELREESGDAGQAGSGDA